MSPTQEDAVRGGRWASGPLVQPPAPECVIMNPHLALCRVDSLLGRTSGEQRGLRPPTSLGRRCGLLCLCQELSAPHPESPSGDGFTAPCQPQGHSKTCDRLLTPAGAWGFSLKLPCLPRVLSQSQRSLSWHFTPHSS